MTSPAPAEEPGAAVAADEKADARTAAAPHDPVAYEAAVMKAFGGKRGFTDLGLPSIVFVAVYTPTQNLTTSLWAAVALAAALSVLRLFRRETLQHSLSGLIAVGFSAFVARHTGHAKDFYLPGALLNIGEAVLFGASALVRWPLVGIVLGPITGENLTWRQNPVRARAYTAATWVLTAMFALRVAIEIPLYLANQLTALGVAKVILSYPLYALVLYICWQIIQRATKVAPPVPATSE